MTYSVEKLVITRFYCPENVRLHENIKSMDVIKLFEFSSNIVPEIGEMLVYKGDIYIITKKVRLLGSGLEEERMILRVSDYSDLKLHPSGDKRERVPLFVGENSY